MAVSGEVGQTIGPVFGSDAEAPTIDGSLVDQVIEYTFEAVSTATKAFRRNQKKSLYQYVGIICEVKAAVSCGVPAVSSGSGAGKKRRARGCGGKKRRQLMDLLLCACGGPSDLKMMSKKVRAQLAARACFALPAPSFRSLTRAATLACLIRMGVLDPG